MEDYYELRSELIDRLMDLEKRIDYLEYLEDANPPNKKFKSGEESTQKLKDFIAIHGSLDIVDTRKVLKMSNRRKAIWAMKKAVELSPDDLFLFKIDGKISKLLPIYDSDFFNENFTVVDPTK